MPLLALGGDQMVSVLAFYFNDLNSNQAEIYSFYSEDCLKNTKRGRDWHILEGKPKHMPL